MKGMLQILKRGYEELIFLLKPRFKTKVAEDLPEKISKKEIYILGECFDPWALAFTCPCGCKSIIQLNLLREAKPRWEFNLYKNKKITVKPSVWRKVGCRSHFFIRKGRIVWA